MRKILGPPGTGKTTRLLHYARTFLKLGTSIDKIGYFAFTKKAASEAKERMLDQNPDISEKQLKHFRTLHSLAFWKLGMKKSEVMQDEHYEDIGRSLGIEVTVYSGGEEKAKGGSAKKKKKFPDMSGDGKVTMKDILMARGVIPKKKKTKKKVI